MKVSCRAESSSPEFLIDSYCLSCITLEAFHKFRVSMYRSSSSGSVALSLLFPVTLYCRIIYLGVLGDFILKFNTSSIITIYLTACLRVQEQRVQISFAENLLLVAIVAVEGPHEPVIFEELAPLPILVHLREQQLALRHYHSLFHSLFPLLHGAGSLRNEGLEILTLPAFQQVLVHFLFACHSAALGQGFDQQLAVAELAVGSRFTTLVSVTSPIASVMRHRTSLFSIPCIFVRFHITTCSLALTLVLLAPRKHKQVFSPLLSPVPGPEPAPHLHSIHGAILEVPHLDLPQLGVQFLAVHPHFLLGVDYLLVDCYGEREIETYFGVVGVLEKKQQGVAGGAGGYFYLGHYYVINSMQQNVKNDRSLVLQALSNLKQREFQNITFIKYNFRMAVPANSLKQHAESYLRKHRIIELMQDLCSDLCFEQPQNINEFLIERLKLKQKQGFKIGIFSKQEISNIFVLFDLKREGFIDKERCKEALKTLANNQFQFQQVNLASLPEKVDEKGFVALCEKVLGAK